MEKEKVSLLELALWLVLGLVLAGWVWVMGWL